MSGFTLDHLKILLKEGQEEEEKLQEAREKASPQYDTDAAIHEFFQQHGILSPIKGVWKRPIPANVYRCPLSEPMTTLVQWDSLPRSIQDRYQQPEDGIVEVNRDDLFSEEVLRGESDVGKSDPSMSSLTHGPQRRPLGGNLTNKLTEYTRGKSGNIKPFTPGGLDADEIAGVTASSAAEGGQTNPYLTPQAIERSLRVLSQGSKASWRDGSLITAPPGVDFKVGLSYEDIYGKNDEDEQKEASSKTINQEKNYSDENEEKISGQEELIASTVNSERITTRAVQWDPSFVDDDSLFGSSVSDSDSDSVSDRDSDSDSDDDENEEEEDLIESEGDAKEKEIYEKKKDLPVPHNEANGSDEDVDQLLTEFLHAEARTKKEIIRKEQHDDGTANNPLRLAERQAKLQHDTGRKSWASTSLLPIDDFHSYIPNPAMTYPFTLDSFQQQAVARLERNESVFVAAHTSAGKTVVAEYAVSLARQRGTRCVYTSPVRIFDADGN